MQGLIDQSLLGLSGDGDVSYEWPVMEGPEVSPAT